MTRTQQGGISTLALIVISIMTASLIFQTVVIKRKDQDILWLSAELAKEKLR